MAVVVKRFDRAGIAERRRQLRRGGRKGGGEPVAGAEYLEEVPAIVRKDLQRRDVHTVDQRAGVGRRDDGTHAGRAFGSERQRTARLRYRRIEDPHWWPPL